MITKIIIHCSATRPDQDICADDIREWHLDRGWSDIGYHYVICRDGMLETGRPEHIDGAHAKGHNADSLGICLVGGIDLNGAAVANFTMAQYVELWHLVNRLLKKYPGAEVIGHRDLPGVTKSCPCFDVNSFFSEGGLL